MRGKHDTEEQMSRTIGDIFDDTAAPEFCAEADLVEIEQGLAQGDQLNTTGVRDLIFTIRELRKQLSVNGRIE